MLGVNIEGKDEKLTIDVRPVEVKLDPNVAAALAKFLGAAAAFLDWVRRADSKP